MKNLLIQLSTVASRDMSPFCWQAAGMGYLLRSVSGRWIVIDGGHGEDILPLISILEEHSDGVPVIGLWIITHPHGDHYGAALSLCRNENIRSRVKVEKFAFSMPDDSEKYLDREISYMSEIENVMQIPRLMNVPYIRVNSGDRIRIDDLVTEILWTVDDMDNIADPNVISLIFRVFVSNMNVLFLGDADYLSCGLLASKMGEQLKCDICQVAHHGLNGGHYRLYDAARPELLLCPMSRPAYEAMMFGEYREASGTSHNRNIMRSLHESRTKLSADGDLILELPLKLD